MVPILPCNAMKAKYYMAILSVHVFSTLVTLEKQLKILSNFSCHQVAKLYWSSHTKHHGKILILISGYILRMIQAMTTGTIVCRSIEHIELDFDIELTAS